MILNLIVIIHIYAGIDECATLTASELSCGENAYCNNNTVGSYECVCNTSYTGDGSVCNGEMVLMNVQGIVDCMGIH